MPKRLNGSADTGKKIMDNWDDFSYSYRGSDNSTNQIYYKFDWSFGDQSGTAIICLTPNNKIDQSSTLNCNGKPYGFPRSLGAYNDSSLYDVFARMLDDAGIEHQ